MASPDRQASVVYNRVAGAFSRHALWNRFTRVSQFSKAFGVMSSEGTVNRGELI